MSLRPAAILSLTLAILASPFAAEARDYFDDTNGVWTVSLNGQLQSEQALTECYEGTEGTPGADDDRPVTLRFQDKVLSLRKQGNKLVLDSASGVGMSGSLSGNTTPANAGDVELEYKGLETWQTSDDRIEGKFFGKTAVFRRDTRAKPPVVVKLPGDRPWVRFMREILIPKTAEDRETYHTFRTDAANKFLKDCQLYRTSYWMTKYMKGGRSPQGKQSFENVVQGMSGARISPRSISSSKFGRILKENMAPEKVGEYALAKSSLGMYFATAAGGAVRIPVTDNGDSLIYYMTDRRADSRNGLVVMATPSHAPLASSFGKWLNDFSLMDAGDDMAFTRTLLETMVKSSTKAANQIKSAHGRSAYTDYLGVMAIEDQRGVMFGNDGLSWGYNMTSGSFTALIARALAHGQTRAGPKLWEVHPDGDTPEVRRMASQLELDGRPELAAKVIVQDWSGGPKLQPGNCSYFDTLNGADDVLAGEGTKGGNDFQEGTGMATLRRLTTKWLRAKHPDLVKEAEESVAMFIPAAQVSGRSRECIFHLLCENFFHAEKFSKVTPEQGERIINAGMALMKVIHDESKDLEAFILLPENGVTKSDAWAPRASGF